MNGFDWIATGGVVLLAACGASGTADADLDTEQTTPSSADAGNESGGSAGGGSSGETSDSTAHGTDDGATTVSNSGTSEAGTGSGGPAATEADGSGSSEGSSGGGDQGCGDRYAVLGTFEAGESIPTQGTDLYLETGQSQCYELSFADDVLFSMVPFSGHPFAEYQASSGFLNFRITTSDGTPVASHTAIAHVEVDDLPLQPGTYVIEIFGADVGLGDRHLDGHTLALGTVSPASQPYVDLGQFDAGEAIPVLRGGVIVAAPSNARTFRLMFTEDVYLSGQLTIATIGFPDLDIEGLTNVGDSIHVWSGLQRTVSFDAERVSPGVFEITVEPVSISAHHTTADSIDAWELELASTPAN